jgi:hypothetical protein
VQQHEDRHDAVASLLDRRVPSRCIAPDRDGRAERHDAEIERLVRQHHDASFADRDDDLPAARQIADGPRAELAEIGLGAPRIGIGLIDIRDQPPGLTMQNLHSMQPSQFRTIGTAVACDTLLLAGDVRSL